MEDPLPDPQGLSPTLPTREGDSKNTISLAQDAH